MKNQDPQPKGKRNPELRINLSAGSKEVLDSWHSQLKEKYPGIKISYSDLVNWCLSHQASTLSDKDFLEIESEFFDAVKQLEWLLAEARAKKAQGKLHVTPKKLFASLGLASQFNNGPQPG